MKAPLNLPLAILLVCFLAGCTTESVSVTTDYDRAAQFGKYKSYTLAPPKRGGSMSPLGEAALRDALRDEMSRRGIAEVSGKRADLIAVRHAFIEEKVSVQQYTDWSYNSHGGWPYGFGYYGFWGGAPVTYTDVNQYGEGTLILDLVDARTKKLVFRGVGRAVVGGARENAAKVREAVAKMFAAYPGGGAR